MKSYFMQLFKFSIHAFISLFPPEIEKNAIGFVVTDRMK